VVIGVIVYVMMIISNVTVFYCIQVGTITSALNMCRAIRNAHLTLIVGFSESGPESVDSFIADLSVGEY
jgi:enolase